MPAGERLRKSKSRRVVHKSTGGMLNPIPEPVDPVGNAPSLSSNTVAHPYPLPIMGEGSGSLAHFVLRTLAGRGSAARVADSIRTFPFRVVRVKTLNLRAGVVMRGKERQLLAPRRRLPSMPGMTMLDHC